MARISELSVGQLFVVEGHRPQWGRSEDGSIGTIVSLGYAGQTPDPWGHDHVYVDLYRRHRTSGKPLKAKESRYFPVRHIRPVSAEDLSADQRQLIAHNKLARFARLSAVAAAATRRIAWERSVGYDPAEATVNEIGDEIRLRIPQQANIGIELLFNNLRLASGELEVPHIEQFFARNRVSLEMALHDAILEALVAALQKEKEKEKERQRRSNV